MFEGTDFPPDVVQPSLLGELQADISAAERADALARLARLAKQNRQTLEKQTREFEAMCEEARHRLPSEGLVMLAKRVRESEAGARELLYPWMDALRQAQSVPITEGQRYIQELLEFSRGWLALYQKVGEELLKLAAERRPADQVLRARPVEGEIDHLALSREFMARYPKLRAALAR
jgi:hypothetical protein